MRKKSYNCLKIWEVGTQKIDRRKQLLQQSIQKPKTLKPPWCAKKTADCSATEKVKITTKVFVKKWCMVTHDTTKTLERLDDQWSCSKEIASAFFHLHKQFEHKWANFNTMKYSKRKVNWEDKHPNQVYINGEKNITNTP